MNTKSDIEQPGVPPFTRGIYPDMYRGRLWTMRQYSGYATAAETNSRFKKLLNDGQTGLSVAFDLPTQIGYDADHPMARGEVGRVGVSICSLEDMERLFQDIPLKEVSTSMTINATAGILLALYIAVGKRQGALPKDLRGTVQNDILKEYIARGTYIYPAAPSLRLVVDVMRYCNEQVPQWNSISVSGYHIREAGATAVQELAFTLADGIAYLEAAVKAGLAVDDIAPRISFFFNAQINLFEEVAKFRAARRLWCTIVRDRFGAKDAKSWMLRFHTQTAGASLTAQQPEVNIVRTTIEALAAVLGGTQSLHTNGFDEALGLPTENSARLALRTQQVLGFETGVATEPDPLGGSPYIEKLTDELERSALEEIEKIDDMGGAVIAVEKGYFQNEIGKSAYLHQQEIESKARTVVGVNKFTLKDEPPPVVQKIPPASESEQIERVRHLKERRDKDAAQARLNNIEKAARTEKAPLIEPIIEAVEALCTVGEISDRLRKVWGEYAR